MSRLTVRDKIGAAPPPWLQSTVRVVALLGFLASLSSPGATVSLAIVAVYGLCLALMQGIDEDLKRVHWWMLACYCLLLGVDLLNGGGIENVTSTGVNYLTLLAIAPYAFAIRLLAIPLSAVERVLQATVAVATVATIYLTLLAGEQRPGGLNLNSVPFSFVVALWGVWLLSRGLRQGRAGIASLAFGLAAAIPVLLSESKIALICLAAGYLIVGLIWAVEENRWKLLGASVVLALLAAMMLWMAGTFWRIDEFFAEIGVFLDSGGLRGGSFGQRYQILTAGWAAFLDRPLLGYGLNERMDAVFSHITGYDIGTKSLGHLHNDYITHLVSYGVFGAAFLVAYFVGIWRLILRRADPASASAGVAMVAMLIIYMAADVAFNMDPISGATTIALGLILALSRVSPVKPGEIRSGLHGSSNNPLPLVSDARNHYPENQTS